jgi:hypothetical protein
MEKKKTESFKKAKNGKFEKMTGCSWTILDSARHHPRPLAPA